MQLPAIATIDQAVELLALLEHNVAGLSATSKPACLQIDASAVREFDTSLLAWLLQAKRRCTAVGAELSLSGAPPKLGELARLYGLEGLLPLG